MTEGFPAPFSPRPTEKVRVEICVSSSSSSRTSAMAHLTSDTPIPSSASRPQTLGVVPVYPPLGVPSIGSSDTHHVTTITGTYDTTT